MTARLAGPLQATKPDRLVLSLIHFYLTEVVSVRAVHALYCHNYHSDTPRSLQLIFLGDCHQDELECVACGICD
jgi:hypothetical protein